MNEHITELWNKRFGINDYAYGTEPNDFLSEFVSGLPEHKGQALSLGDGEGRNGVWLAQLGYEVTSLDLSDVGLKKAVELAKVKNVILNTRKADITELDWTNIGWSLIVAVFVHMPPNERLKVHTAAVKSLVPGGHFIMEGYTKEQINNNTGGPKDINLLYEPADVLGDLDGLADEIEIIHSLTSERDVVEGTLHSGRANIMQLVVRKK